MAGGSECEVDHTGEMGDHSARPLTQKSLVVSPAFGG